MKSVISIEPRPEALVAVVQCSEFDHSTNEQFKTACMAEAAASSDVPMILDFSKVTFVASSTLGVLVELRNKFMKEGRRIALAGVSADILKLMKTCSIQELFEVHDTVDKALA